MIDVIGWHQARIQLPAARSEGLKMAAHHQQRQVGRSPRERIPFWKVQGTRGRLLERACMFVLVIACLIVLPLSAVVFLAVARMRNLRRIKFTAGVGSVLNLSFEADADEEPELPRANLPRKSRRRRRSQGNASG
jgi:hypothetical protein